MSDASMNLSPVQEFYKGQTIFITGGTGFMGKVLVEKLLYSCSEVKEILILMRPKRGKVPEARVEEMLKLPIFNRIKEEKPEVLKKLVPLQGDVTFDSLGLSGEQIERVSKDVTIVFHCAATSKLEANLKDAIDMNTTGTKRVINLCKKMENLKALVHLSTAFCNCDIEVMREKVYDCPHNPEDLIRMAEWMDAKELDKITPELLTPHPNTYTYSKRLAEVLVQKEWPNMPIAIARPSIGLDKLTNAFGLSAVVIGVALLSGTPIASALYEHTGSYLSTFVFAGILLMLSGVLIILAFPVYLWQERKNKK